MTEAVMPPSREPETITPPAITTAEKPPPAPPPAEPEPVVIHDADRTPLKLSGRPLPENLAIRFSSWVQHLQNHSGIHTIVAYADRKVFGDPQECEKNRKLANLRAGNVAAHLKSKLSTLNIQLHVAQRVTDLPPGVTKPSAPEARQLRLVAGEIPPSQCPPLHQ